MRHNSMGFDYSLQINNSIWSRSAVIKVLEAALELEEYRFAGQLSLLWLASFPGDIEVKLLRAKASIGEGLMDQAIPLLENIVSFDPEYGEAFLLLSQLYKERDESGFNIAHSCALALGLSERLDLPKSVNLPEWPYSVANLRAEFSKKEVSKFYDQFEAVLAEASHVPLVCVTHLQMLRINRNVPQIALFDIATLYNRRWPECLQFAIVLSEALIKRGEPQEAVALLHKVASQDVNGQVITRILGPNHPYKNLWPRSLSSFLQIQIPSRISAHLGWNLITAKTSLSITDEILKIAGCNNIPTPINQEDVKLSFVSNGSMGTFTTIDKNKINISHSDENQGEHKLTIKDNTTSPKSVTKKNNKNISGLFPIYVIFTTQKGLKRKYGSEATSIIDQAMRKLAITVKKRLNWGAVVIYADDPNCTSQYGVKPAQCDDPWQLKLALSDLQESLEKRGAKIGALLIVGGPEIVPFHNLPNPTDDFDAFIPSDNPYATRDENYFVQEWPVGRLPDGFGKDPNLLITSLRSIADYHAKYDSPQKEGMILSLFNWLISLFQVNRGSFSNSFGITAEAWRKASRIVFRSIGDPNFIKTSPPEEFSHVGKLPSSNLGYFNLHGVIDSPEWFGQKDPENNGKDPQYPVALHPKSIQNGYKTPNIVFSEACYGAHIYEKGVNDSLALKFLESNTYAFIGSTVISYGSVTTPLNAADLLCKSFWDFLNAGHEVGDALHRAKIFLVSEMHRRQGYLDGEDQKTLISFVLFGDPLQKLDPKNKMRKPVKIHSSFPKPPDKIITICDRVSEPGTSEPIPEALVNNVKNIVSQYLPGMANASLALSHAHAKCSSSGHACPTSQLGAKSGQGFSPEYHVITLRKRILQSQRIHETYARLTFNKDGKFVKLAVSR